MTQYHVESIDNIIPKDLAERVWNYIQQQTFHATRKDKPYPEVGTVVHYIPAEGKKEYLDETIPSVNNQYMHRCIFGNCVQDLEKNHLVIEELWAHINGAMGNKFEIAGDPEGMADDYPPSRVYVNAQPQETIKRSHGIHRDTIDLEQDKHFTLLYIANLEWPISWMAENIFYNDDSDSEDKQQYQKGVGQSRGFGIGYPYALVAPKPGRVIIYDGRALHTTKPASAWAKEMRYAVVFRVRMKSEQ